MPSPRHSRTPQSRRGFLKTAGLAGLAGWAMGTRVLGADDIVTLPFENGERPLVKYPQKRPLIRLTSRPPQLETPFSVFNEGVLTPNDAFFVRYHLMVNAPPPDVDAATFRVEIKGKVNKPASYTVAELKAQFETVDVVAVNQCSGNGRGFFQPR